MTDGGALASVVVVLGLVLAACGGQGPIALAAEAICDAIDAEPSDEIAFAEFERAVARERRDGLDEGELRAAVDERCGRAVAAISAAALAADEPEPEPELEPEPEPEPVFVDLASLDWEGESWSTDCTPEGERRDLRLTPEVGVGAVHRPAEGFTPVYVVDLDGAVFGDVTGDGHQDAIFVTKCVFASPEVFVEVWSHHDNGQPRHLPPVHHFSKFEAVVDHVEAVGGKLRIHSREGAVGDNFPHLDGYPIEVVTDWSFDGERWVADEVLRTEEHEAAPAPEESAPAHADECANPDASSAATVLCLVAAINAQDYTTAATVAAADVVATLRSVREDWGPLDWQFDGCEWASCGFYEPSPDPQFHGVTIEMGVDVTGDGLEVTWVDFYG